MEGRDLEATLKKIYSNGARYYLVFMDKNYFEKVWARYEKDIMASSGRKEHIIPVILDDNGAKGLKDIPSGIAHIDLRQSWSNWLANQKFSSEDLKQIRNRCVLPLLEKVGLLSGTI